MGLSRGKRSSDGFLAEGQRYLLGVYGGVGPLSHTLFEQHMLTAGHRRGARRDQEHPVWLLVSASSTPNRMESLAGTGPSAESHLRHYAELLERAGADVLFVICNTAHAYHRPVQRGLGIPWVHLMAVTAEAIRQMLPGVDRVGVMGTDGTLTAALYHDALAARGLQAVSPDVGSDAQRQVMEAIFNPAWGIKATGASVSDRSRATLEQVADWMADQGAGAVIAGCTEVSVALTAERYRRIPIVDPLQVAAELAVEIASGRRQPAEFLIEY